MSYTIGQIGTPDPTGYGQLNVSLDRDGITLADHRSAFGLGAYISLSPQDAMQLELLLHRALENWHELQGRIAQIEDEQRALLERSRLLIQDGLK